MSLILSPLNLSPPLRNFPAQDSDVRTLSSLWALLSPLSDSQDPLNFTLQIPLDATVFSEIRDRASLIQTILWEEDETCFSSTSFAAASNAIRHSGFPGADDFLSNLTDARARCLTINGAIAFVKWLPPNFNDLGVNFGSDTADFRLEFVRSQHSNDGTIFLSNRQPSDYSGIMSLILALLGTQQQLRTFSFPSDFLSDRLFDELSTLQELYELNVTAGASISATPTRLRPALPSFGQFNALRILSISGCLADAAEVLRATTESISELWISSTSLQRCTEIPQAIHSISDFCAHLTFIMLDISNTHPEETDEWMDLWPLCECATLQSVFIRSPRPLPITDLFIDHVVQALVDLEILSLNPRPQSAQLLTYNGELPTLMCLESVARSGLRLKTFAVFLRPDIADNDIRAISFSHETLEALDLGRSGGDSIGGEYSAAAFIRSLFPRSRIMHSRRNSPWTKRVAWRHRAP